MAHAAGLTPEEMRIMNIGDVLEYVYEWVRFQDRDPDTEVRKATQADIDNF